MRQGDKEHAINPGGILYAARANVLNDPTVEFDVLAGISQELFRRDRKAAGGGRHGKRAKRVSFAKASQHTKDEHLREAEEHFEAARGKHTRASFSEMIAECFLNDIEPRGHGAKATRRFEYDAFMAHLLDGRARVGRQRVRKSLADAEKGPDHVQHMIETRRRANAAYSVVEQYRAEYLIPHPSKGVMRSGERKTLAFIAANVRCPGPTWAEDDVDAERMRAAAVALFEDEVAAGDSTCFNDFVREEMAKLKPTGKRVRGRWQVEAMRTVSQKWRTSPLNPANQEREAPARGPSAWRAAAAASMPVGEDAPDAMEESESPLNNADVHENNNTNTERNGANDPPDPTPQPDAPPIDAPPIDLSPESMQYWRWGALMFMERGGYEDATGAWIPAGFVTEIGKDQTLPGGYGSLARASLREAAERLGGEDGGAELHLITRKQYVTGPLAGQDFTPTADARTLFLREFEMAIVQQHNVGQDDPIPKERPACQVYGIFPGQVYLRISVKDLLQRLGAAQLRGGAQLLIEPARCKLSKGSWWQQAAVSWMRDTHRAKSGGDGAKLSSCVPGDDIDSINIYAIVPRSGPTAQEASPAADQQTSTERNATAGPPTYEHTVEVDEELGTTTRVYDGELVEGEFVSATGSGRPTPSWGDTLAREVVDWLLLERLKYNVILPAGGDGLARSLRQKFGIKVSLDAAAVRKARKGAKHWTTLIVQVLCQGVGQGIWGQNAVAHMLHKAQSPDYIATVTT